MADAPLSFIQLMRGVSKVHKGLAESIPGARRIPEEMASKVEKMMPLEVLDEYNKRQMYGKTSSGEPYRGVIKSLTGSSGASGRLPDRGNFIIAPESVADKIARGQIQGNTASNMSFYRKPISQSQYPLTFSTVADVDQIKMAGQPPAEVYDINAMDVGRGMGPMQYRAMYDMINAGGDVNKADFLTDINVLRRLGNVAPIAMTQQGLRGIVPVSESAKLPKGSYSQQLFSQPVDDMSGAGIEKGALSQLFGDYDDLVNEAMKLTPADLRGLDQDALAGLLYSREAQLTKSYGPEARGAHLLSPKHIGDANVLSLYDPYRIAGQKARDTSIEAGIGPNTIARTRTTEDALARILRGETPEEIVENLRRVMGTNVQGFKGRYAKGGLASALQG